MSQTKSRNSVKTLDMIYVAMFAVLITVCAWISIPTVVPFTLQTFAVFCTLGLLGGKRGTLAVLIYLLLGAIGLPVFAGFKGGLGALFGVTGGYLVGFLASGLVYWLIIQLFGKKTWTMFLGMILGLLACYVLGTAWFLVAYARTTGAIGIGTALSWCVFPFIIPDIAKIIMALLVTKTLSKYIKIQNS